MKGASNEFQSGICRGKTLETLEFGFLLSVTVFPGLKKNDKKYQVYYFFFHPNQPVILSPNETERTVNKIPGCLKNVRGALV